MRQIVSSKHHLENMTDYSISKKVRCHICFFLPLYKHEVEMKRARRGPWVTALFTLLSLQSCRAYTTALGGEKNIYIWFKMNQQQAVSMDICMAVCLVEKIRVEFTLIWFFKTISIQMHITWPFMYTEHACASVDSKGLITPPDTESVAYHLSNIFSPACLL